MLSLSAQVVKNESGKLEGAHNREIVKLLNAFSTGNRLLIANSRRAHRNSSMINNEREKLENVCNEMVVAASLRLLAWNYLVQSI